MQTPHLASLGVNQWFGLFASGQIAIPPADSPDWTRCIQEVSRFSVTLIRLACTLVVVCVLVVWPLDVLFLERPPADEALFTQWRLSLLGTMVGWYLASYLEITRRHPLTTSTIFGGLAFGAIGWFLARVGGLEQPFFYMLCFGLIIPAGAPAHLLGRVAANVTLAGAMVLGFFGSVPAHLEDALLLEALFYLALVVVASTLLGHVVYVGRCINFFQGLAIERSAATLEELNRTLDQRVRQKTIALARLTEHLQVAQDEERGRIARELHDELGQRLSATRFVLANTRSRFARSPTTIAPNLAELDGMLDATLGSMRGIVSGLRPPVLDQLGLAAAIEWLANRTCAQAGLTCTLDLAPHAELDPEVSVAAFRVLQESLTNVIRHAQATRVDIRLQLGERLRLEITDNGRGLPADCEDGNGLLGMRERAEALEGEVSAVNMPSGGVRVCLDLPRRVPT